MACHFVTPEPAVLHGTFSRDHEPILAVEPGDTVILSTLDPDWRLSPPDPATGSGTFFAGRRPHLDDGHALCGPIAITGAQPGMTLAVTISETVPGPWGWSRVGGTVSDHNSRLGLSDDKAYYLRWDLDRRAQVGRSHMGHTVALRPFMGVFGMPPDEPGYHSTHPPRYCGGNLDCRELVPGTTLFLPISVAEGLFSIGDGHAVQGDGEMGGTAIECPMERVVVTFHLHPRLHLKMPRALTPQGWVTFGFAEDLTEAAYEALKGMAELLQELFGFQTEEAYALLSLTVDMRVTQLVNGIRGAHAFLPHGALR